MHSICYGRSILPNRCWLLSPLFRLQSCTPAKSFYFEYSAAAKATRKLLNCSHSTTPRRFHDDWRCLCPDRPAMQVYNALLVVVGWPFLLGGVLALIWVGIDLPGEGFIPGLYLLAAASITGAGFLRGWHSRSVSPQPFIIQYLQSICGFPWVVASRRYFVDG